MVKVKNREILKILVAVIVGVLALSLLVSCNNLVTEPSDDESVTPSTEETPTTDSTDRSDEIPGAKDFTVDEKPSDDGAVLSSPAYDMFLKIEGVPGESTDKNHEEWIEILSYNHGVSQPVSGVESASGVRTAERCDHQDFSVVKTLDKASPKLALFCSNGQHITEVILVLCCADGDKSQYMEYKMTNVIISSVSVGGSAGTEIVPVEEVTFNYGRIEWTYTEHDPVTGKAKGDVKAYWDVEANKGG